MGGSSKSTSDQIDSSTNLIFDGNSSIDGAVVTGDGNTVTTTDYGAIAGALDFGADAVSAAASVSQSAVIEQRKAQHDALNFAAGVNSDSLNFGRDSLVFAERATREAFE